MGENCQKSTWPATTDHFHSSSLLSAVFLDLLERIGIQQRFSLEILFATGLVAPSRRLRLLEDFQKLGFCSSFLRSSILSTGSLNFSTSFHALAIVFRDSIRILVYEKCPQHVSSGQN